MIGAPFSSFGMRAALMFLWAVYDCSNSDSAVDGVQVPAGVATSLYLPEEKYDWSTSVDPCANSVALLSVAAPFIKMSCGLFTPQAAMQDTRPVAIVLPTVTLLNET